ncbi:MAG: hypothetical protein B6244_12130 [Candidatus Cloacimonetes bacterium 4572_55]|nr:MAG: hypothetical protein B6244_12130 [Candidatus Cloacimonetes bacterium 4572_55]
MRKKKILLVDDDALTLEFFCKYFTREGFHVITVMDGKEAISKLQSDYFDLIVTDLIIPDVDGLAVLQAAKKQNPEVIVIILTGYGDISSAIEALRLGADDYLLKPCDTEELLLRSQRCFEKQMARSLHLHFLENMARIDRVIRQETDVEQMMSDFLQATLEIFEADRAWLLYPCDPDAESWSVPMERTRPEFPGALALGEDIPMLSEVRNVFRKVLEKNDVVTLNFQDPDSLKQTDKRFFTLSQMHTVVHTRTDKPWVFGVHQCSHCRDWTDDEKNLFREIGRRLGDGLSSLLLFRNLEENEANLRAFMENARGFGVYCVEIAEDQPYGTQTVFFSPSIKEILGIENPKENANWFEHIHSDDLDRVTASHHESRITGKVFDETFLTYNIWKQEWRWLRAISSPVKSADGIFARFNGLLVDITERKRAEEALRASEENLRITLNSIGDAVIATDKGGNITGLNPVAESLTGWSAGDAMGKPLQEVFHIVNEHTRIPMVNPVQKILRDKKIIGLANHTTLIAKNGSEYHISDSGAPILDRHGELFGVVLVFRDVSESRKLEQAKINFINAISHELRTPLTPILGYAEIMSEMDFPFEKRKRMLQEITKSVQREQELVDELLAVARLQSRQERYSFVELSADDLFKNIFYHSHTLVKQTIKERYHSEDFNYTAHISDDLKFVTVEVDPDRIQHILENLLTNAIKYSPSNRLWIECRAELNGEWVAISVRDRGRGIPKSEQMDIFKSFYQIRTGGNDVSDGIGQGLTLVKLYVEAHGGAITVESELNHGSLFTFTLPIKKNQTLNVSENP